MIKTINNKRCKTLLTYLDKDMPEARRDYIKREIGKIIKTAKEILTVNKLSNSFDAFKYKGGLVTCIDEIKKINSFITSGDRRSVYAITWVAELYQLALKMDETIKYTDEMINSLRSQGNYHGVYNIS